MKNLYELARCHARLGQTDTALAYLDVSLATGFDQGQALAADEAFAAMTDDPRFTALTPWQSPGTWPWSERTWMTTAG